MRLMAYNPPSKEAERLSTLKSSGTYVIAFEN
jgi:hypothetical protein